MNHGHKGNHLGRTKEHRRALMRNLSAQLIEHKRIFTTLAKAKALRSYIEPLVTRAKNNTTHNRRVVFRYVQDKAAVTELFGTIAAEVGDRPGGYVRVIRTGFRKGDGAEMAMIEFVDFNKEYSAKEEKGGGRRRRRRGGKGKGKAATAAPAAETATEAAEEAAEEATEATEETATEVAETAEETTTEEASEADEASEESKEEDK
ncbi:MAG: 50S ribosomal protein L17 [Bacteroidetes bacterium]|nr:MAG: 50S ribosomal protein L17 [Bacteroidota bacterium]